MPLHRHPNPHRQHPQTLHHRKPPNQLLRMEQPRSLQNMLHSTKTRGTTMRITGTLQREKTAILFLRKNKGYSTNILAKVFGRSQSLIHRVLKFNVLIGNLAKVDMRSGIPDRVKKIGSASQLRRLQSFMVLWEPFLLGETSEPP